MKHYVLRYLVEQYIRNTFKKNLGSKSTDTSLYLSVSGFEWPKHLASSLAEFDSTINYTIFLLLNVERLSNAI